MTAPMDIVREARTWKETPFQHQGRKKRVGVDCAGLVVGVAAAFGIPMRDQKGYGRHPDGKSLQAACEENLVPIALDALQPGDVLLFRIYKEPQHVGIVGDYPGGGFSLIHAYNTIGKVVESHLSESDRARIVAAYRLPGVESCG